MYYFPFFYSFFLSLTAAGNLMRNIFMIPSILNWCTCTTNTHTYSFEYYFCVGKILMRPLSRKKNIEPEPKTPKSIKILQWNIIDAWMCGNERNDFAERNSFTLNSYVSRRFMVAKRFKIYPSMYFNIETNSSILLGLGFYRFISVYMLEISLFLSFTRYMGFAWQCAPILWCYCAYNEHLRLLCSVFEIHESQTRGKETNLE